MVRHYIQTSAAMEVADIRVAMGMTHPREHFWARQAQWLLRKGGRLFHWARPTIGHCLQIRMTMEAADIGLAMGMTHLRSRFWTRWEQQLQHPSLFYQTIHGMLSSKQTLQPQSLVRLRKFGILICKTIRTRSNFCALFFWGAHALWLVGSHGSDRFGQGGPNP